MRYRNLISYFIYHIMYFQQFARMNINISNVLSFNKQRSGQNTLPATLNSLSTGAGEVGIKRCVLASWARLGSWHWWV